MSASLADKSRKVSIDLENQTVLSGNQSYDFDIDSFRKHCLMNGLDDIGLTLAKSTEISSFEQNYKSQHPWV
jgi:3-isopropylmalate/(R)-2-methylmalate dehydratase small subunit